VHFFEYVFFDEHIHGHIANAHNLLRRACAGAEQTLERGKSARRDALSLWTQTVVAGSTFFQAILIMY